jgi:hypothetical protein
MRIILSNRFVGNLTLTLATLLILLSVAEVVCRVAYSPENLNSAICFDSILGWRLKPGISYRSVDFQRHLDYLIKTNSLGFRDGEVALDKPAGRRRILLIGDSVTFGTGVDSDWRFSDFMQRALNDEVEVINTGVPGWGTDQELLFYETTVSRLKPDIVILTFTMANDVVNNALPHLFLGTASKPRFAIKADSLQLVDTVTPPGIYHYPLWKSVAKRSRFLLFVKRRLDKLAYMRQAHIAGEMGGVVKAKHVLPEGFRAETAGDLTHWSVFESPPSAIVEDAWRVTEALISRFGRDCREHGATPVMFALPPRIQVDTAWRNELLAHTRLDSSAFDFNSPFERLSACCVRNRIPFVYPHHEFSHPPGGRTLYHLKDAHPNRYGHALAARALLEYLEQEQSMHYALSASDRSYILQPR